jgi:hypothetical protein
LAKKKRADREAEKRRAEFMAAQQRLGRRRNVVGLLGFVPLAASLAATLGCASGTPLDLFCVIPRDVWLLIWAAIFGSFLGLTIRLIRERRKFLRGASDGRSA